MPVRMKRRVMRKKNIRKYGSKYSKSIITRHVQNELPRTMFVKMKYSNSTVVNCAVGTSGANHMYSMNSVYDPLYSVGGGSCSGFAQLSALYNNYCVTACKAKLHVIHGNGTDQMMIAGMVGIKEAAQVPASAVQNIDFLTESKDAVFRVLAPYRDDIALPRAIMTKYFKVNTFAYPQSINDIDYSGNSTSDPVQQPLIWVGFGTASGDVTTSSMMYFIQLTYYTRFYNVDKGVMAST